MKYESAWVKQRTDRTGKPWVGYLKYRGTDGKWKQTCKVLKTWTDAEGNEKPVRGKRQAEKALATWRQEMEATSSVTSEKTYVNVYMDNYLNALALKDDPKTITRYRSFIKNYFGDFERIPLGKLTHGQVQAWVLRMQEDGLQPNTILNVYKVLKMTCRHAVKVGDIMRDPCANVELPSPPKPTPNAMEPTDIHVLLCELDKMLPARMATAASIALLTGLRCGEVCALKWTDWDEGDGVLSVTKSIADEGGASLREKGPKTAAGVRDVPVPPRLKDVLGRRKAYMVEQLEELGGGTRIDDLRIIGGEDGSTTNPHILSNDWGKYAKKRGLVGAAGKKLTFHSLRDCYATTLLGAGVDVKTAADLLGHSDGGATLLKYYASALDGHKRNAALRLNAALDSAHEA